ncbi:hypothetical protein NC652_021732 [Populus alba x Populus x berolinensis]|uniref:Uncharacterized protein n=1 Tax=Populus alba x Populus x berolinensis TaxID=444605 RepID=A0AAD6MNE7_9ROSI|nr:hypothetical protein NC652_021732 [Populus alba x Populus x berolinensis]KAJ6988597.1 hypothetical protein NC653_021496 [Populus alba x Populus x berolinensis]KAJ6988606.1 hypothetical protein NC653_021505 [Populus alba x Populus x berolinensis]
MDKQGLKGTHPFSMDMVKLASTIDTRWSRSFNENVEWWWWSCYVAIVGRAATVGVEQ